MRRKGFWEGTGEGVRTERKRNKGRAGRLARRHEGRRYVRLGGDLTAVREMAEHSNGSGEDAERSLIDERNGRVSSEKKERGWRRGLPA
jgi:hypothetical protein